MKQKPSLHIMMIGLCNFFGSQGAIESHIENLFPGIVKLGCKVTLVTCSACQSMALGSEMSEVKIIRLWGPKLKGLEHIIHAFSGVLYAAIKQPDILHIHAQSPGFMVPIAQLLGLRVVVTQHGSDCYRQKWGGFIHYVLCAVERFAIRKANARIVISETLRQQVIVHYGVDSVLIPNGVNIPDISFSTVTLERLRLNAGCYILLVGDMLPEKRHSDLIQAFVQAKLSHWKLVLVGKFEHPDAYTQSILDEAKSFSNIVCAGFQSKDALNELYSHAGACVVPSSHERFPMVLLEAISYGLPVLASNISVHKEVGLSKAHYFSVGNIDQLTEKLNKIYRVPYSQDKRQKLRHWVKNRYNWDNLADKTLGVYLSIRH